MLDLKLYEMGCMRRLAVMLMSAVILISCNGARPDPECVESGDLGANLKSTVILDSALYGADLATYPDGRWIDTKLDVEYGKKLSIKSAGEVFLCMDSPQQYTYAPITPSTVDPKVGSWQDSGIILEKDNQYTVEVSGEFVQDSSNTSCPSSKYVDSDCWSRKGQALFGYIPGNKTWGSAAETSSTAWFGTENQDDSDGVFELYRRDTSSRITDPQITLDPKMGMKVPFVSQDTKLWFRYRDDDRHNTDASTSFTHPEWYGDNTGGYTITVKRYSMCKGTNGKFVEAEIRPDTGPVVPLDVSSCSAPGNAQTDQNTDYCNNGMYSKMSSPASGRVWLKIHDVVDPVNHNTGDGVYTHYVPASFTPATTTIANATQAECTAVGGTLSNTNVCTYTQLSVGQGTGSNQGTYNVTVVTPKPNKSGSITSVINSTVEPVRKLLRGTSGNILVSSVAECNAEAGGTPKYYTCSGLNDSQCSAVGGTFANPICNYASGCATGQVTQVSCDVTPKPGLTERIFKNITNNGEFISGVRAMLALAIVLFAFSYMAGISTVTHKELLNLIFKLVLVEMVIGPDSWAFFSKYLFSFFIEGTDNLIWIMSNNINNLVANGNGNLMARSGATGAEQGQAVFSFLNTTMTILFSQETWIKIQALLVSFPIGVFYVVVMIVGIGYFLFSMIKAILMYITSIIMTALLLFLAPIFICCLLFSKTKDIFSKWLAQLAIYAMQPVLLFIVIAVFNVFILMALYTILDYTACYTCVWYIPNIFGGQFCFIPGYVPWGFDTSQNIFTQMTRTPAGWFPILIFVILTNIMLKFIGWVDNISTHLVGNYGGLLQTPGSVANKAMGQAIGMMKETKSSAWKTASFAARNLDNASGWKGFGGTGGKDGNRLSNTGKMAARNLISKLAPMESFALGRKNDAAIGGQRVAYGAKFRTGSEQKGYDRTKAEFDKLDEKQKQEVIDANAKAQAPKEKRSYKEKLWTRIDIDKEAARGVDWIPEKPSMPSIPRSFADVRAGAGRVMDYVENNKMARVLTPEASDLRDKGRMTDDEYKAYKAEKKKDDDSGGGTTKR